MRELFRTAEDGCSVEFLTISDKAGYETYKRSAVLLMLKAVSDVAGMEAARSIRVHFTVSEGFYCTAQDMKVDERFLTSVKERMEELAAQAVPIEKKSLPVEKAIEHFERHGMKDKARLFRFRRSSTVNVYCLDGFEDYYYGYMVPDTGYLKCFDLIPFDEGFVLEFPPMKDPGKLAPFAPEYKVFTALKNSGKWSTVLGAGTVGALN